MSNDDTKFVECKHQSTKSRQKCQFFERKSESCGECMHVFSYRKHRCLCSSLVRIEYDVDEYVLIEKIAKV